MKAAKRLFIFVILIGLALGNALFALAAPLSGELPATATAGPSAGVRRGERKVYFYLHDYLGGISAVTDEEGNVVERRDYLPYGADRLLPDAQYGEYRNYGFTGKEKDPESELYYYGARFYDPFTGRFISQDPLLNALDTMNKQELNEFLSDPQNWNSYSYAKNNPLLYIDPTGESPVTMGGYGRMLDETGLFLMNLAIIGKALTKENIISVLPLLAKNVDGIRLGFIQAVTDKPQRDYNDINGKKTKSPEKMLNSVPSTEKNALPQLRDISNEANLTETLFYKLGQQIERAGKAFGDFIRKINNNNGPTESRKKPRIPTSPTSNQEQKSTPIKEYENPKDSWNKSQ